MDFDPRLTPRLRDRAVTRLNDLTAGAAALGVVATAGFGTVAALTTHAPGVSSVSSTTSVSDDSGANGTTPQDNTTTQPSTTGSSRSRSYQQLPSTGGTIQPPTVSSGRHHASTGGS